MFYVLEQHDGQNEREFRTIINGLCLWGGIITLPLNKMRETQFKVLMYAGQYVDTNMLEKGIYSTSRPSLYSKNETIEGMEKQCRDLKGVRVDLTISDNWFKNLRECELINVSLVGQF